MMRRILYIVLPLLFFAACKTDLSQQPGDEGRTAVSFGVEGLQSRAVFDSADAITSLGLFGYSTGTDNFNPSNTAHLPDLFHNRQASRTAGGDWTYAPLSYWPLDPTVRNTFFAYAPHSSLFVPEAEFAVSRITASGYPTITYTVPNSVHDQMDILYASPFVANTNHALSGGKVLYPMKHALTWLLFAVAPEQRAENTTSTDIYNLLSLRFIVKNMITCAELNLGTGVWRALENSSADYEFDVLASDITAGSISVATAPENRLMIIPQTLTKAANNSSIDVVYTVRGQGEPVAAADEYFYSIPFPDTILHQGNVTIYLLRLSDEGIKVTFYGANTIDEWLSGGGQILEVF